MLNYALIKRREKQGKNAIVLSKKLSFADANYGYFLFNTISAE